MRLRKLYWLIPLLFACGPLAANDAATPTSTPLPNPSPTVVASAVAERDCTAGRPEQDGLTTHQVYRAYSRDGRTFAAEDQLLVDQASVPDGVIGPDGALWLYYVNGVPGQHGVFAAAEQADGTFSVIDCIYIDGRFEGDAVDPDIMRLPDGSYRLFYFFGAFIGVRQPQRLHDIHSAVSYDGLNFVDEGPIFSYEEITDPSVIALPNGEWLMAAAQPALKQAILARSSDGQTFSYQETVDRLGIPELALMPDGAIHLYMQELLISTDYGLTWQEAATEWVPSPDPSLVQIAPDDFVMFYKRFSNQGPP